MKCAMKVHEENQQNRPSADTFHGHNTRRTGLCLVNIGATVPPTGGNLETVWLLARQWFITQLCRHDQVPDADPLALFSGSLTGSRLPFQIRASRMLCTSSLQRL